LRPRADLPGERNIISNMNAPAESPSESPWWHPLLYLAGLVGGMLACYPVVITSGFERVQTDHEDVMHMHYMLEHSWRWLAQPDYPATFWTPRFFHPTPNTFAYSENLIGTAPLYWAFRPFCSAQVALQWWTLLNVAACYVAMLIVLRWFGLRSILAVLGAYVFAFHTPRQAQCIHLLLMPQAMTPFAIWYFWKLLQQPDRRTWVMLLVMCAWQLLAGIHLGWFLAFALAAWLIFAVLLDRSIARRLLQFTRRNPVFFLLSSGAVAGTMLLFFRHYFIGNHLIPLGFDVSLSFAPVVASWFAATPHSLWDQNLVLGDRMHDPESFLFTGFVVYGLSILAGVVGFREWLRRSNNGTMQLGAFLTIVFLIVVVSKTYDERSFWYPFNRWLPGANGIRAIGRACFLTIPIGLIAGLTALQQLVESSTVRASRRTVLYSTLLIVAVIEQFAAKPKSWNRADWYTPIDALSPHLKNADAAFVLYEGTDGGRPLCAENAIVMWAGMNSGMPVVNGYSSRFPPYYPAHESETPIEDAVTFLGESWQGRLLVIERLRPEKKRYFDVRPGKDSAQRLSPVTP